MASLETLPLHRKYRPNSLKKYIGNEKLKVTAMRALRSDKIPQVVLVYGSSGCGKTTFARVFAKEVSCLNRDEETGACGECANCQLIDEYIKTGDTTILTNIREIDITDQSGKRDLDAVLEDMSIPAYDDEWKIYIFDECHMASPGLQNRLLKIAEEPPEHVLMILCTTNPEKLIETLKNRCQLQLRVSKPTVKELSGLLKSICSVEDIDYDRAGLEFLANRADLTIRTALTNLEQVITEQGSAKYEAVTKVFEEISNVMYLNIFKALKTGDTLQYVSLLCDVKSRMPLDVFWNGLKAFVVRGVYIINNIVLEGVTEGEMGAYKSLFGSMGVSEISILLDKISRFNPSNLEMELLMLGYTGFNLSPCGISSSQEIVSLSNEITKELGKAQAVIQEAEAESYQKGVENGTKAMDAVSMDDILAMGGMLVE